MKHFIARPVCQAIFSNWQFSFHSQNDIIPPFVLKLSVNEDGLTVRTGLTIKSFTWNWHIIYPTSHRETFYHNMPKCRFMVFCSILPRFYGIKLINTIDSWTIQYFWIIVFCIISNLNCFSRMCEKQWNMQGQEFFTISLTKIGY